MFGAKESKKMLKTMRADELFKTIVGMPVRNSMLKEINIREIQDVRKVDDTKFRELATLLNNALTDLKLYQADDINVFKSGDQRLYWVPQEYFP